MEKKNKILLIISMISLVVFAVFFFLLIEGIIPGSLAMALITSLFGGFFISTFLAAALG